MKVTTIEEAQDISKMQVDELIGSLQTFELTLTDRSDKKNKNIAFMSNTKEEDEESEMDFAGEFTEALALLGRKFNKAFKKLTEGQGRMSLTSCLTTLESLTTPGILVFNAEVKMKKGQISLKGFNAMSVKGMVISSLNVQHFSRSKRRAWWLHGLMMIHMMRVKM